VFARLGFYGLVGGISSVLHALILVSLPSVGVSLSTANLTGFVVASLWSYVGHSKFSFRHRTQGKVFPRRWLFVQLATNSALCLLLPSLFGTLFSRPLATLLLVSTPTAVNYGVWSMAARHLDSRSRRSVATSDLGSCRVDDNSP
jgi:putative flippase GtrA